MQPYAAYARLGLELTRPPLQLPADAVKQTFQGEPLEFVVGAIAEAPTGGQDRPVDPVTFTGVDIAAA